MGKWGAERNVRFSPRAPNAKYPSGCSPNKSVCKAARGPDRLPSPSLPNWSGVFERGCAEIALQEGKFVLRHRSGLAPAMQSEQVGLQTPTPQGGITDDENQTDFRGEHCSPIPLPAPLTQSDFFGLRDGCVAEEARSPNSPSAEPLPSTSIGNRLSNSAHSDYVADTDDDRLLCGDSLPQSFSLWYFRISLASL